MSTHVADLPARTGTQIRGPSALGGDWRRFFRLTWTLAALDFKLKFFGSVLGYFWQLAKPLMLFGVLYVVFTQFAKLGDGVPYYGAVLLMGIVIFMFFSEGTSGAVNSVVDRESLVRKIHFPRVVIPLSAVLTSYFNFLLNFIAVLVFMIASGVQLRAGWFELVPLLLVLGAFSTGLAMFLSAAFVRYRDVRPIWDVVLQMTFYATPILYPIEKVVDGHETLAKIIMCSPLAVVIEQLRHALIDPSAPTPADVLGSGWMLLIPAAIVVLTFLLGFMYFDHQAPRIAEEL